MQYGVLLSAAEQHHRTMTLIAAEASQAIFLEGPGAPTAGESSSSGVQLDASPTAVPASGAGDPPSLRITAPGQVHKTPLPDVPEETSVENASPIAVNPVIEATGAQLESSPGQEA